MGVGRNLLLLLQGPVLLRPLLLRAGGRGEDDAEDRQGPGPQGPTGIQHYVHYTTPYLEHSQKFTANLKLANLMHWDNCTAGLAAFDLYNFLVLSFNKI